MSNFSPRNPNQFKNRVDEKGRECSFCGEYKVWNEFAKASKSYTGHSAVCKTCKKDKYRRPKDRSKEKHSQREHKKTLRKNDPIKWRSRNIRSSLLTRSKRQGIPKENTPTALEIEAWLRNQQPLTCYYTGVEVDVLKMHVDHKIPLNRGGDNSFENLCVTDARVNSAKGQMNEVEFKQLLQLISEWEDGGRYLLIRLRQGFMGKR